MPKIECGEDFKTTLQNNIITELKLPKAQCLKERLGKHLGLKPKDKNFIQHIAQSLLKCEIDVAIRDYLTLAATDCLESDGNESSGCDVAEQILGWLVLASIDETQLEEVLSHGHRSEGIYFALAAKYFSGVEIALSRRFFHTAAWGKASHAEADPKGRFVIQHKDSWFVHDTEEPVNRILQEIWNAVYETELGKEQKADLKMSDDDVALLNEALREGRLRPKNNAHHYIAFKLPENHEGHEEAVYDELLKLLPEMTVVRFGLQDAPSLFLVPEARITAHVNAFYCAIKKT